MHPRCFFDYFKTLYICLRKPLALLVVIFSLEQNQTYRMEDKSPSTLIRFQTKTELFCSGFKKICVHTYRFRIVFARPHYNNHQERSHMEPSVRHFGYSRSSGLAPGRVYLDDVTVFTAHTRKQRFQKASFSNRSTLESVFE